MQYWGITLSSPGSLRNFRIQNVDGTLIAAADMTKEIKRYNGLNYLKKIAQYFGLQYKPSRQGMSGKKTVTNKNLYKNK